MCQHTPNQFDRFDRLEVLRKAAWESFQRRSGVEWKINLSIWGLYAAMIAGIFSDNFSFRSLSALQSAIILGVITAVSLAMAASHWYWLRNLSERNDYDRKEEAHLLDAMRDAIGYREPEEMTTLRKEALEKKNVEPGKQWNPKSQRRFTMLLTAVTILAAAGKICLRENWGPPQAAKSDFTLPQE